ncbi:MAG: hypothetical protein IT379_15080 [Deltaproteobacteria bacterium]|nr:hypothetical protein [Deltaproteobacteria bacterium]
MKDRLIRTVVVWIAIAIVYLALGWVIGLAIAPWFLYFTIRYAIRLQRALARTIPCPQGHAVAQWGRFRCTCGAETLSWIWRCAWCRTRFGHSACGTCGLAVGNPLLRR